MNNFTANDYLATFCDAIPPVLVSPADLAAMRAIARQLPGALTSFFGFECRLGETDAPSDILFAVNKRELEVLAGRRAGLNVPAAFWQEPVWQRARAFAAAATDPTSPLHDKVDDLWLEFDLAKEAAKADVPVPSIFFGSQHLCPTTAPGESLDWFTTLALPTLYGARLTPAVEARVGTCIQALPPRGRVFEMGAMMSRQPPFVRLCISNVGHAYYPEYLDAIGWRGARDALEEWIRELAARVDAVFLDIDVSETVGETVGLECYFEPRRAPQYEPRWYPFLDFLQEKGLLTDAKRAGLIDYCGFVHEKTPGAAWPPALLSASRLLGTNAYSSILRGPHHIKIVLRASGVEAKGYFYVEHYWLKPGDLKKSQAELATPKSQL